LNHKTSDRMLQRSILKSNASYCTRPLTTTMSKINIWYPVSESRT